MVIKEISTNIGEQIPQWLLYILGTFVLILYGFIYVIDKLGLKLSKKVYRILFRKKGHLSRWKLKHHEFFEYSLFLLDYKIENLSFSNSTREEIMKDFIKSYVESIHDHHVNLLNEDIKSLEKKDLKRALKSTLFNAIEEHENNFILQCENEDEKEIARLIIRKFNEYHSRAIEGQSESIDQIFENEHFQRNNYELVYNIFNIYHASMISLIINSTKVFQSLNGELEGLYYKGNKIEKVKE